MKKIVFTLILIFTLLAITSSTYAAVTRDDFKKAFKSYANSIANTNKVAFMQAQDVVRGWEYKNTTTNEKAMHSYENNAIWLPEGEISAAETALYFTDDTFIAYLFNQVAGVNMKKSEDKLFTKFDIYDDYTDGSLKTNCNLFEAFDHNVAEHNLNQMKDRSTILEKSIFTTRRYIT